MPKKMEQFTQRARRILSLAQEEAETRKQAYIGTEHILLGLMREEGGVAGRVLRDIGIDQRTMVEVVDRLTRIGQRDPDARLELLPETKKILELAVDEARRMDNHYIGTEHVLLGLLRQTDITAIEVLKELNVNLEMVRSQVQRVLKENPIQNRPPQSITLHSSQTASVSA